MHPSSSRGRAAVRRWCPTSPWRGCASAPRSRGREAHPGGRGVRVAARRVILDAEGMGRVLEDVAARVAGGESADGPGTVLVGVRRRGVPLAERLRRLLEARDGRERPVGALDITLYRDDFAREGLQPEVGATDIAFDLTDRRVVLVDDVLYTGRTVRAALTQLADFGRPYRVELAVLVDRGHRELPIQADHVGLRVTTDREDRVEVRLEEVDGQDRVELLRGRRARP
ncbi:MAG: bifunctional pyr operon transcriptional regulator/uracil phosphoribosyltransferase PyrR [Planctomycetes bacterium]|nr:bifunctional pyr operon transcriptional regulator/uracil phosphoribosyltransferase PyrR [Planctomycetota bacterium]